jgi:hypothetical protein
MASFANITLADGQSTPANHTFTVGPKVTLPDGTQRFVWQDFGVNDGIPIGANRIELDVKFVRQPARSGQKADSRQLNVSGRVIVPTMETLSNNTASGINPQPTLAYETTSWFKYNRNGRSVAAPVKDAVAFTRNFQAHAVFTDTLLNYSPPSA